MLTLDWSVYRDPEALKVGDYRDPRQYCIIQACVAAEEG
jgi:hypothetical protein